MKTLATILSIAALTISFTSSKVQADTLAEVMKAEGIEKMLGTWVDADTNGENVKLTYKWKIKSHAVELNLKTKESSSTALIVYDQASEKVIHVGVNSKGELTRGNWSASDGAAVLNITQTNTEGQEVELKVTHKAVDKNTMSVAFEMKASGEGGEVTLVRPAKKPKAKKEKGAEKKKKAETKSTENSVADPFGE